MIANPRTFPRHRELEAAIRRLPIRREWAWFVSNLTDRLAMWGNLIAEQGGSGIVLPNFRPAGVKTIENELYEIAERTSKLAYKIEKGGGTKRAREQLARHIRNLHGPTMGALLDVDAVVFGGRQILADTASFTSWFPERLKSGCDVSVQELRFWTAIAYQALHVPLKPRNVGRPPDRQALTVAIELAYGYRNLTGKEPTFTVKLGDTDKYTTCGKFLKFVQEIFGILNIHQHDEATYASLAARSLRGRGRKK